MGIEELVEELYREGLEPAGHREIGLPNGSTIIVKLEYYMDFDKDPLRTVKRKPATLLLHDTLEKGYIKENKVIVTASSGNFLRELALQAIKHGFKVIGVTPPVMPRENQEIIRALGVDMIHVSEEYDLCPRETTVFFTRALAEKNRFRMVNIDQYYSWQNVLSHVFMTWREVKEIGDIDYVCAPLGSTGTFMGLCLGSRLEGERIEMIGIQPPRTHHIPGVHHIIGECEWNPEIFSPTLSRNVRTVDDVDSYAGLLMLWEKGVYGGPSTGMGFIEALRVAEKNPGSRVLTISADSIYSYRDYVLDFLPRIRDEILSRYPHLEETLEKYLSWLRGLPTLEERLEAIRRTYRPEGEVGRVYQVEEALSMDYSP